jgi:hypothetical protein
MANNNNNKNSTHETITAIINILTILIALFFWFTWTWQVWFGNKKEGRTVWIIVHIIASIILGVGYVYFGEDLGFK